MKCSMKTMTIIGIGLAALLGLGYGTLPGLRVQILQFAPFLLVLLCPLSMMLMMWGMQSHQDQPCKETDATRRIGGKTYLD